PTDRLMVSPSNHEAAVRSRPHPSTGSSFDRLRMREWGVRKIFLATINPHSAAANRKNVSRETFRAGQSRPLRTVGRRIYGFALTPRASAHTFRRHVAP